MENEVDKNQIKEKILETIEAGKVTMKPRWHFVLRTVVLALGAVILFLALLYLVSFIFFIDRFTGLSFAPGYGTHEWYEFFTSLPWLLILLAAIFVILLELLVRRYSAAYRNPLIYSLLGIVLLVIGGGVLISQTPLHIRLFHQARRNQLPVAGPFYMQFVMQRFPTIHRGIITSVATSGFVIEDFGGETSTVIVTPQTRLPYGDGFMPGDTVLVIGPFDATTSVIDAVGVQKLDPDPDAATD